jgi:hypothetical protein
MLLRKFDSGAAVRRAAAGLIGALVLSVASAGEVLDSAEAQARASWRGNIEQIETPARGCFHASYPNLYWEEVACRHAQPRIHSAPRNVNGENANVVGNGHDYAAGVRGLIFRTVGSFPIELGARNERSVGVPLFGDGGILGPNEYSIQINSNFGAGSRACQGVPGCLVWEQFIYATDYYSYPGTGIAGVFIEYWLLGYGDTCPTPDWFSLPPDCVINSAVVPAPNFPIADLAAERMSASAVVDGEDTLVFTHDRDSYALSAPDSVVDLATVWKQSEFNVFGDAGGSEAVFNPGSLLWLNVAVSSGSFAAPSCISNAGTTGESNNLNLGRCLALPGFPPSILFPEQNLLPATN